VVDVLLVVLNLPAVVLLLVCELRSDMLELGQLLLALPSVDALVANVLCNRVEDALVSIRRLADPCRHELWKILNNPLLHLLAIVCGRAEKGRVREQKEKAGEGKISSLTDWEMGERGRIQLYRAIQSSSQSGAMYRPAR
jgi:hypothetical protein